MAKDWRAAVKNAKSYKALGQTELYLDGPDYPWELVYGCEPGGSHRLDISTDVWFRAKHSSGLQFRWSFDIEPRSANGKGTYEIDVKSVTKVMQALPAGAKRLFGKYLAECAAKVEERAREYQDGDAAVLGGANPEVAGRVSLTDQEAGMTFGSLFSGIGGMDLGLERAGMECRWQVEIDPFCLAVLDKHWPEVPKFGDIKRLDPRGLAGVDLVCGGFPCQPFSSASRGRKRGTSDDRWLWPEMRDVVDTLRPSWVLVENVTQLDGPGLEQVVSDLEACDYQVAPPLEIPACAFGHDHRRARLWILGHTNRDCEPERPIDAEVARLPRDRSESGRLGKTDGVPSRMDRLAGLGNAVVPQVAEWIGRRILDCARAGMGSEAK